MGPHDREAQSRRIDRDFEASGAAVRTAASPSFSEVILPQPPHAWGSSSSDDSCWCDFILRLPLSRRSERLVLEDMDEGVRDGRHDVGGESQADGGGDVDAVVDGVADAVEEAEPRREAAGELMNWV